MRRRMIADTLTIDNGLTAARMLIAQPVVDPAAVLEHLVPAAASMGRLVGICMGILARREGEGDFARELFRTVYSDAS
jgi:hypothetical protein